MNRRITALQAVALPLGQAACRVERETGFEPATSTLARSHSTTELFPLSKQKRFIYGYCYFVNIKFGLKRLFQAIRSFSSSLPGTPQCLYLSCDGQPVFSGRHRELWRYPPNKCRIQDMQRAPYTGHDDLGIKFIVGIDLGDLFDQAHTLLCQVIQAATNGLTKVAPALAAISA